VDPAPDQRGDDESDESAVIGHALKADKGSRLIEGQKMNQGFIQ
jgi:hypothetical protein